MDHTQALRVLWHKDSEKPCAVPAVLHDKCAQRSKSSFRQRRRPWFRRVHHGTNVTVHPGPLLGPVVAFPDTLSAFLAPRHSCRTGQCSNGREAKHNLKDDNKCGEWRLEAVCGCCRVGGWGALVGPKQMVGEAGTGVW